MIASTKNGAIDWLKVTTYFILLTGASLRLIQYLGRSSYWKDELFSVVNIEKMSMVELLTQQPEYNQVAGPGFYIIQKSMVSLFGDSIELVPRLYPLSASILSLWVFYLIVRKFLSGFKLLASLVLISFSIASLGQSFQARPYSGDIFFIMFFVHSIISLKENHLRAWQYWATGIVGMIGATASLPTAIFVLGAIALLVWQRVKDATIKEALPCLALWGLGALANILYVKLVISQDVRDALLEHWSHGVSSP